MDDAAPIREELALPPVLIPVDAYVSPAYAAAENVKLWGKVWQVACRVEEIPGVGDYVTYDIVDESITVVRTAADTIKAFYNVCQHRGRRLTEGCGHAKQFACKFHGWRWDINGENVFCRNQEDWGGALDADNLRLPQVKVGQWGGWGVDQHGPGQREPGRLPPAGGGDAGPVRAGEDALPLAPVALLPLQLEDHAGGVQRELPRQHHPPRHRAVRRGAAITGPRPPANMPGMAPTRAPGQTRRRARAWVAAWPGPPTPANTWPASSRN